MSHTCATGCGKPATATLCPDCTAEVVTALRELATGGVLRTRVHSRIVYVDGTRMHTSHLRSDTRPGLYEDLIDTLARKDHTGGGLPIGGSGGGAGTGVTFHQKASELKDAIDNEISTWARDVAAINGRPLTATTIRDAAAWLAARGTLLAAHPAADELHRGITRLVRAAARCVDRAPERVYLGQCGNVTDDVVCEQDIYVLPGRPLAQCDACGAVWSVRDRRDYLLANVADQLATPPEISKALSRLGQHVTESMIYGYAHRATVSRPKLTGYPPHPRDPRQRTRYRIGDVRAILDALSQEEAS